MNGPEKLKAWMKSSKTSTLAVCVKIGVYPNQVSRILKGQSVPSLKTAFKIQEMTGGAVLAEDFLEGEPEDEERHAA